MNLPNRLTLARLVFTALFVLVVSLPAHWRYGFTWTAALALFLIASGTDWLDGYLARRWNLITDFGKLLDPLADKILVAAALFYLVEQGRCPVWMAVLMVAREFLITGLRVIAASKGIVLAAERLGKHKTVTQMLAIFAALAYGSMFELDALFAAPPPVPGGDAALDHPSALASTLPRLLDTATVLLFWLATLITVYSGAVYLWKNRTLIDNV